MHFVQPSDNGARWAYHIYRLTYRTPSTGGWDRYYPPATVPDLTQHYLRVRIGYWVVLHATHLPPHLPPCLPATLTLPVPTPPGLCCCHTTDAYLLHLSAAFLPACMPRSGWVTVAGIHTPPHGLLRITHNIPPLGRVLVWRLHAVPRYLYLPPHTTLYLLHIPVPHATHHTFSHRRVSTRVAQPYRTRLPYLTHTPIAIHGYICCSRDTADDLPQPLPSPPPPSPPKFQWA